MLTATALRLTNSYTTLTPCLAPIGFAESKRLVGGYEINSIQALFDGLTKGAVLHRGGSQHPKLRDQILKAGSIRAQIRPSLRNGQLAISHLCMWNWTLLPCLLLVETSRASDPRRYIRGSFRRKGKGQRGGSKESSSQFEA